jgi:hypothetical protein
MAIFFTSDTHFGHAGARALYRRPFGSVAEMDAAMVDRWNMAVGADDEVWHLGDFALGISAAAMANLLARLHGRKHLIAEHPEMPLSSNGWFRVLPSQILAMPYSGRPSSCCRWAVVGVQGSSRWRCRMGAGA